MTGTKDPVAKQIKIYCVAICVWFLVAAGFLLFEIPYVRGAVCRAMSISDYSGMRIGYILFFIGAAVAAGCALRQLWRLSSAHKAIGLSRSRFAKATTWIRLLFLAIVLLVVAAVGFWKGVNVDSIYGNNYIMPFLFGCALGYGLGPDREHYLEILDEAKAKSAEAK